MINVEPLRYGVFQLGQLWTVVGEDGSRLAYVSFERALTAAALIAATHRAYGHAVIVVVQNEVGEVVALDADGLDQFKLATLDSPARLQVVEGGSGA